MSGLDRSPIRFAVRCGSCGERATTTISLRGVTVPVCLRHYNVWKTPDFDAFDADERTQR